MKRSTIAFCSLFALLILLAPTIGYCSVETTLRTVQDKLVGTIMPLAATLGLVISAFSFFTGNPNARVHLYLAIFGAVIGFGAESIVTFIRTLVH
jgi:type IV secretory pathway VirB2 component (pilin)